MMNDDDIGRLLRAAREALTRQGEADAPQLDAEMLLSRALGKPRSFLYAWPDHVPTRAVADRFRSDVAARAEGQPVAYTLGVKEFFGLELAVTPAVLIPRPDTELLVELALELIPARERVTVADLGTGSGAIALSVKQHRPQAIVIGSDISSDALAVARGNAAWLELDVPMLRMHWCRALADASLDLLLANPPYIANGDPHLPQLRAEPSLALLAGDNGLDALGAITADAPRVLRRGGWLVVEHGHDQRDAVAELFLAARFGDVRCEEDLGGNPRVTLGRCAP